MATDRTTLPGGIKIPSYEASGEQLDVGVFATSAAPVSSGNGRTLAGIAGKGSLLVRTNVSGGTTGVYQNTGTKAAPVWTAL